MSDNNFSVLVTGAASGIGAAAVDKFIAEGASCVIAVDINAQALAAMVEQYAQSPVEFISVLADVSCIDNLHGLQQAIDGLSRLDAVVLSHGVADENLISETDIFEKVMKINLLSCQSILSICESKLESGSSVIFVSSILGKLGNHRNTGYCTSKHAQLGMMKALAMDWARLGIRVNAVLPCYVDTPMLRSELQKQADMTGNSLERVMRQAKKRIPMRKYVETADIANAIYFFSSDNARMITAQSLLVDGGSSCGV